jgi:hypothetical protein
MVFRGALQTGGQKKLSCLLTTILKKLKKKLNSLVAKIFLQGDIATRVVG